MHTSSFATSVSSRCALVAGVALLALASCSSDKSIKGASATSSSSSVVATSSTIDPTATTPDPTATSIDPTATTIDPTLTTVAAVTTTAAGPAPTAAPPPPSAPPAAGYTPLGAGRMVVAADPAHVFPVGSITCGAGMSFDYGEVEQCVEQDDLMVISYRIPEAKRVVEAYVKVGGSWAERYQSTEEFDFELTAVNLYIADYAGSGRPSAFVGYRIDGTGHFLDFDIVQSRGDGTLDVRGMRGIDHGNVGLPTNEPGVVVSAVFAGSDPNCCPTSMRYQSLAYVSGAWSVNDGTLYPTASAPSYPLAF